MFFIQVQVRKKFEEKYILGGLWDKNYHCLVSSHPGCDETTFKAITTHQI